MIGMVEQKTHQLELPAEQPETVWQMIRAHAREVWQLLKDEFHDEYLAKPLHPDFAKIWKINDKLTWYQNKSWGPAPSPEMKVGFYFNELSALDNCPWVAKFGNNLNAKFPDYKYFCIAFGNPRLWKEGFGLEKMKEWTMQFDHPSLMKYNGDFIEMLK